MKILQISSDGLGKGGVQKIIMDITKSLSDNNRIDVLLFTNEKRFYEEEFLKYGGKIYRINGNINSKNKILKKINYYIRGPKLLIKMIKIMKKEKYDVVHCHNGYEAGICVLAAYLSNIKVRISHLHRANYHFYNSFLNYIYNKGILKFLICRFSTDIVFCSENAKGSFFRKKVSNKVQNKIKIVLNGFNSKDFDLNKYKRTDNRKKYNLVNVGGFSATKNQGFIIDLMPTLIKKMDNVHLNLVGHGEYKKVLEKKIKDLRLDKYVKLLPEDTNIPEILSNSNLFIHTPIEEGFGIVLLEAQAMEVPCLVANTVSKEINFGLVTYKSMKDTKEQWVDEIIRLLKYGNTLSLDKEKLKLMDDSYYVKKIESIYKGEYK